MCVVSMIMDHYRDEWGRRVPSPQPYVWPQQPFVQPYVPPPSDEAQQEQLRKLLLPRVPAITDAEIEEFRKLLDRAREYDKRNSEPDCEMDEKRQAILDIAKRLGVEISFL
jgi:hypothetical protein